MSVDVYDELMRVVVSHKGISFVQTWLTTHAHVYVEGAASVQQQQQQPQPTNRGRKSGAAPDEQRCMWAHTKSGRCKNSKLESSNFCKIHITKAALIGDDALVSVSAH
jgi:hypothetical protein